MENLRKSNYAKTEGPIEMIFRCFTAVVITNIVLKFGYNRAKEKGVTGGSEFVENSRNSNYAETESSIKVIFRCSRAKVIISQTSC